jgi:hypothetical protein
LNTETFARAAIADFCIREGARHGGVTNMAAVAWVLRNRVMAGWGDWYTVAATAPEKRGVIYDDWKVDLRNSQVRIFLSRIDLIHSGIEDDDPVNGAVYYTEMARPQTIWFMANVLHDRDEHPLVAQAGPVFFFT